MENKFQVADEETKWEVMMMSHRDFSFRASQEKRRPEEDDDEENWSWDEEEEVEEEEDEEWNN